MFGKVRFCFTRFIQAAVCHHTDRTISSSKYLDVPRFDCQSLTAYTQFGLVSTPSRSLGARSLAT